METLIQQQHVKRRRTRNRSSRSVRETTHHDAAGLRTTAERILAEVQQTRSYKSSFQPLRNAIGKSSIDRHQTVTQGAAAVRSVFGQIHPVYAAMMVASLMFLMLLLTVQHNGGLPGTWVFTGTQLSPPANTRIVDSMLMSQLESLSSNGHSDLPIDLDLAKFEQITFSDYTMQSGDTLSGVANRFGLRMDTLVSFNQIRDVRRMQIGTRLQIPSRDGLRHTVARGESLNSIASRYQLSSTQLIDANNLRSESLSVGQELFIPDARMNDTDLRMVLGELFVFPTRGRFTSGFGYRSDPFTGVRRFHNGVDWANVTGTRINAARVGRVADQGSHPSYGNYIIISHDGGFQSLYAHLHTIETRRGQYVSQGQRIGSMGTTGRSTGTHLHFSIFHNGNPVDPLRYLH